MDRNTRTLIVVLIALVTAGAATYAVYRAVQRIPVRQVEVAHSFVAVAARTLPMGSLVTASDVKMVPWPERSPVVGAFSSPDKIVNRGLITQVLENEPLTESKLAPVEGGAGLPPTIPEGMRAISVRVNEVVGVAGFVVPGTRVDVLVTLRQGNDAVTRVIVSNVQVLTAGTRYNQEKSRTGEPIPTSVVTLLLTPPDAERVVLAGSDGQIMLALRNPLDRGSPESEGTRAAALFGTGRPASAPAPVSHDARPVRPRPQPTAAPPPPPPPAPAPKVYTVEAIRAAKRTEEAVR